MSKSRPVGFLRDELLRITGQALPITCMIRHYVARRAKVISAFTCWVSWGWPRPGRRFGGPLCGLGWKGHRRC
jgi:hypothetical protein